VNTDLNEFGLSKEELWKGCILASLAHAIMVAHHPNLSNEHSWDELNYSVQDSSGGRGTITFSLDYVVAAFRNDNSHRLNQGNTMFGICSCSINEARKTSCVVASGWISTARSAPINCIPAIRVVLRLLRKLLGDT